VLVLRVHVADELSCGREEDLHAASEAAVCHLPPSVSLRSSHR